MNTTFLSASNEELKNLFFGLRSREDLATLLEISDYQLRYHLYIYPVDRAYTSFKIPKKLGGHREILAPTSSLKIIQRKTNQILSSVYQPKPSTHGFTIDKSVITNARAHLRQRYILNIDIKDFFPSINFGRVRGLLMAAPYNCTEEVATVLAKICCHKNYIPQGAPTSPVISNMICARLDSQLQRLAKKYQCIYTRYADDITFSTSRSRFPSHLAWFSQDAEKYILGYEVKRVVEDNGFFVNEAKFRLQSKYGRQEVTGITVNEKLNIRRSYIRRIRTLLHVWENHGIENAEIYFWNLDKKHRFQIHPDSFRHIVRGKIEFIGTVRGKEDIVYLNLLKWLKKLAPDLVSDSKFDFLQSQGSSKSAKTICRKALIWTEGKTDILHLKSALRSLTHDRNLYEFEISFKDDLDSQKQGDAELLAICRQFCKNKQSELIIAIFDRDNTNILKDVDDQSRGFKVWGNRVYSLVLPVPKHRQAADGVCIELYYQDEELQRQNRDKRRIFLSNEFNHKSGRHHDSDLSTTNKSKIQGSHIGILDSEVFDSNHHNVALSKSDFANYIFQEEEGFNDFDFEAFREVFDMVEKVVKYDSELIDSE
jgi:RNA-directed DNA polymerase